MKIDFTKPFSIIKRKQDLKILFLSGKINYIEKLEDIPRNCNNEINSFDTLSMIPFSQIKEKGYEVHDSGLKISCLEIKESKYFSKEEISEFLPNMEIEIEDEIKNLYSPEKYVSMVNAVIEEEIGNGEGANFVIPNNKTFKIKKFTTDKALSIFSNLLKNELNSYWTFIFFDGEKFLIGATPEAHIVVKNNRVKMHPISGTFRKNKGEITDLKKFRNDFINFLYDEKEINELFMVMDEELKMMASFCEEGGMIIGPLLKEMSALIHTEYLLTGKSKKDIIDLLRESMFAATIVGSPIENACKIVYKYEGEDRRYFGSTIALIGKEDKKDFLDSPILIRTIEVNTLGEVIVRVGSTLVRNSNALDEVSETEVKIASMLQNITNKKLYSSQRVLHHLEEDDEVLEALGQRNQKLSRFWFFNQEDENTCIKAISGKEIIIINHEDDFCFMLKHMFIKLGGKVKIIKYNDYKYEKDKSFITVIGPGPGNPNNLDDKKMKKCFNVTKKFLDSEKKFISICLGHQILCNVIGIPVKKKKTPCQGVPKKIDFFGKKQIVGFYNAFEGKLEKENENLIVSLDKETKGIYAIRDKNKQFASFQFHPESILSQNGYNILKETILYLIKK